MSDWMQELLQLAPSLRGAGVLKLGEGDKWAELAPADTFTPSEKMGEKAEDEDEGDEPDPLFDKGIKLRAYDAPGDAKK